MSLTEELAAIPAPQNPPAGWRPRSEISDSQAFIVTEPVPVDGPAGETDVEFDRILEEHGLNPGQWKIRNSISSRWQTASGEWRHSSKVSAVPVARASGSIIPQDLDDLQKAVRRVRRKPPVDGTLDLTVVGVLADEQAGKADSRGGTEELLARLELSRLRWVDYIKSVKPSEIVLADAGDPIENFESHAKQDRTNDLGLMEQVRVWRRIFWTWIETAADLCGDVKVISVPSNHGAVRRGKNPMGPPSEDFGIEVLAQVADIARANPDKYGHVKFHAPGKWEESLALKLVGGKVLGLVHGHQVQSIEKVDGWWQGQSHGRTPVGQADILVHGHFHNLRVSTSGDDRWIFGAPTADAGSAWFRNLRGHDSAPGVLTFCVGPDGWGGLSLC